MAIERSNNFTLMVSKDASAKLSFAHSQNASISFSNSLVEATLGASNGWTELIPGKKTTSIQFSGLSDYGTITNRHNVEDLADFLLDEDLIEFQIGGLGFQNRGRGYISEITLEGPSDNAATYSGVLSVVGELTNFIVGNTEKLQDSDGNDILDDSGDPIYVKIF